MPMSSIPDAKSQLSAFISASGRVVWVIGEKSHFVGSESWCQSYSFLLTGIYILYELTDAFSNSSRT